jgi:UDP-N-acetyl-D-glucosamine dehydrogenase
MHPGIRTHTDSLAARRTVAVQGLGFVGAAMATAVADARDDAGAPLFDVIGIDLPNPEGEARTQALNEGRFPIGCEDETLIAAVAKAHRVGNLRASTDAARFAEADVVLIDVNLDIAFTPDGAPTVPMDRFREAVATVGRHLRPDALVIIETTVPPGTCARVVAPTLANALRSRGEDADRFLLAHSYERVMPGPDYLSSVVNLWRVYAGHTEAAANACAAFLSSIINVREFPLRRLKHTTESETAKLLENTYRAVNIALIDEWARFAEAAGVDLFDVVDAIRVRPTHNNIRQPGFGVGGYCLTKDPLFALAGARELLDIDSLAFPLTCGAVEINRNMPLASLALLRDALGGRLDGRTILLMGASYLPGVDDTRYSASETFVTSARGEGARVLVHDPLVRHWRELDIDIPAALPDAGSVDAVVFAVAHREYRALTPDGWLAGATPMVLDANNVLSTDQRGAFAAAGCNVRSIGRGTRS